MRLSKSKVKPGLTWKESEYSGTGAGKSDLRFLSRSGLVYETRHVMSSCNSHGRLCQCWIALGGINWMASNEDIRNMHMIGCVMRFYIMCQTSHWKKLYRTRLCLLAHDRPIELRRSSLRRNLRFVKSLVKAWSYSKPTNSTLFTRPRKQPHVKNEKDSNHVAFRSDKYPIICI